MYAVIFRARLAKPDAEYEHTAQRLRARAMSQFGCLDFVSSMQGDEEIAISYWASEAQIRAWKNDFEHIRAQQMGRSQWYRSYQVQVLKLVREYAG